MIINYTAVTIVGRVPRRTGYMESTLQSSFLWNPARNEFMKPLSWDHRFVLHFKFETD